MRHEAVRNGSSPVSKDLGKAAEAFGNSEVVVDAHSEDISFGHSHIHILEFQETRWLGDDGRKRTRKRTIRSSRRTSTAGGVRVH